MDSIKKTWPITNDYNLYEKIVLGKGISGKVISCVHKETGERFALKVCLDLLVT